MMVQSTTKPEEIFLGGTDPRIPQFGELLSAEDRSVQYAMLNCGYVDAIAAHEAAILQYMQDCNANFRILEEPLLVTGIGVAFALNDTRGLDEKLTETFAAMRADGTMKQIVGKYLPDPEKYLATICHVDVVPVGNGWTADPFTMRIQDGWLLGRGVADDKGPMVATLYALKFLKEEGVSLRYPIRAMVGDNEETHMNDVEYYLKNYPAPVFCFTPDAEFPVCNGEKGHFGAELVSPVCNGEIKEFDGRRCQQCSPRPRQRTGGD